MKNAITWVFPKNIKFDHVSEYMMRFNNEDLQLGLIFDLSDTIDIHSSFVGFLIHAKNVINMNGGTLKILLSDRLAEIFSMLNIIDHFSSEIDHVYGKDGIFKKTEGMSALV